MRWLLALAFWLVWAVFAMLGLGIWTLSQAAASPSYARHSGSVRIPQAASPPISPAMLCDQAIVAAEQQLHLPAGVLAAVGRAETGRLDPNGRMHPWPYTINAEGVGTFFPTKEAAIAAVQALKGRGVHSIDVGCVQVNLLYHPAAFVTLDQAFDPMANTGYGARFLGRLYEEFRSWPAAIAAYHSRTPELGANYQARVLAIWTGSAPFQLSPRLSASTQPRSPYGTWPPPGATYGALPPPSFAYRALLSLSPVSTRP